MTADYIIKILNSCEALNGFEINSDYSDKENITPRFFRAVLKDGVLDVPPMHSEEARA